MPAFDVALPGSNDANVPVFAVPDSDTLPDLLDRVDVLPKARIRIESTVCLKRFIAATRHNILAEVSSVLSHAVERPAMTRELYAYSDFFGHIDLNDSKKHFKKNGQIKKSAQKLISCYLIPIANACEYQNLRMELSEHVALLRNEQGAMYVYVQKMEKGFSACSPQRNSKQTFASIQLDVGGKLNAWQLQSKPWMQGQVGKTTLTPLAYLGERVRQFHEASISQLQPKMFTRFLTNPAAAMKETKSSNHQKHNNNSSSLTLMPFSQIDQRHVPLNQGQYDALAYVANNPNKVSIIQGPAGTGKSTTIFHIISSLLPPSRRRTLVTSCTNQACGALCEKLGPLHNKGLLRLAVVGHKTRLAAAALPFECFHQADTHCLQTNPEAQRVRANLDVARGVLHALRVAPQQINPQQLEWDLQHVFPSNKERQSLSSLLMTGAPLQQLVKLVASMEKHWTKKLELVFERTRRGFTKQLLATADVVVCTMCTLLGGLGVSVGFPTVIVDEAANIAEESFVALPQYFSKQDVDQHRLILIGDHRQLRPFSNLQLNLLLGADRVLRSMFERVVDEKLGVHMLTTQYRMPHAIGELVSNIFYDGKLKHDKQPIQDRESYGDVFVALNHSHPETSAEAKPCSFSLRMRETQTKEQEMMQRYEECKRLYPAEYEDRLARELSQSNAGEAQIVADLYLECKQKYPNESVLIITFYLGQLALLQERIPGPATEHFGVDRIVTVDSCQGTEADIVILSCVRSNADNCMGRIGFTRHVNRMNVALSRARRRMFLVWNAATFAESDSKEWQRVAEAVKPFTREVKSIAASPPAVKQQQPLRRRSGALEILTPPDSPRDSPSSPSQPPKELVLDVATTSSYESSTSSSPSNSPASNTVSISSSSSSS